VAPFLTGGDSLNVNSVVCKAAWQSVSVLFTGDITARAETVLTLMPDINLAADILKVPHHGSRYSSTSLFLQVVDPVYAVISCGVDNPYGHPHMETLARLDSAGVAVYRTDEQGTVVFSCSKSDIFIDYR
jgi:beta-lactamase superfamily II metal-dependent hydrolase